MLANEKGADVAGIAVVQTMRVIILTAALPIILSTFGLDRMGSLRTRRAGRAAGARYPCDCLRRDGLPAAAPEIPGQLDVRGHARIERAARIGMDYRRPARLGLRHCPDRNRDADRNAIRTHFGPHIA